MSTRTTDGVPVPLMLGIIGEHAAELAERIVDDAGTLRDSGDLERCAHLAREIRFYVGELRRRGQWLTPRVPPFDPEAH